VAHRRSIIDATGRASVAHAFADWCKARDRGPETIDALLMQTYLDALLEPP
jgi:hypothetical protein